MRRLQVFLTIFWMSVSGHAMAVDLLGDETRDPESEATALDRAIAQDPLENTKQAKPVPNEKFEGKEYKTIKIDGGLQLHPSCELEAQRAGSSGEQIKDKMDKMVKLMMDRLLKCAQEYPEMKSYLDQAISQYRRQVVKCEPPKGTKGMVVPEEEIKGSYSAYHDGTTITVSNDWFDRMKGMYGEAGTQDAASTLLHELLHGTKCNNRHDHNDIERIPASTFTDSSTCKDNVSMDRVSVVESLCMKSDLNSTTGKASSALALRMNMCGNDRGCRDLFTSRGNNIGLFADLFWSNPNQDLEDADATRLCQRIKDDGMCLNFRNTQGASITNSIPKVQEVRKRMRERLNKMLPGVSNQMPTDYFDMYPDLSKRFSAFKDSPCFQKHFYIPPDKPAQINAIRTEVGTIPGKLWYSDKPRLVSGHMSQIAGDVSKFIDKSTPSAKCADQNAEIKSTFTDLSQRLGSAKFYNLKFFLASMNNLKYPADMPELNDPNSEIARFIGPDLLKDYMAAMKKHHYESPEFDCVASGVSPFRAMEMATKKPDVCEE